MNAALPKQSSVRTTRRLLACGAAGPFLFMAAAGVEGAFRPGYSAMRNFVSQLATSNFGWQQIANFFALGLLVIAFATGLWRAKPAGISPWLARLLVIFGIALLVAGTFPTDPALSYPPGAPVGSLPRSSWHDVVHALSGLVVFASLTAAIAVAATGFARTRSLAWSIYSALSAVLLPAFCVASWTTGDFAGLYQRIAIFFGWTWLSLFALHSLGWAPLQRPDHAGRQLGMDDSCRPASAR